MTANELERLRREYEAEGLIESEMATDPMKQFRSWFSAAQDSGTPEPNAFTLATVDEKGSPSARAVLVKELDPDGVVFYTGMDSRKSKAMGATGVAAATFVWLPLHRQVRFEGSVAPVDDSRADAYFASRPRGAQIAAHASHQSVVTTKEELEERYSRLLLEFEDADVPRPSHWGGWKLEPTSVEFWQGQPNRFHDRVRYSRGETGWLMERLAP